MQHEWPAGVDFIKTELSTGRLFASIALEAPDDTEKRSRCTANARLAYETALRLVDSLLLEQAETSELESKFQELREMLMKLGIAGLPVWRETPS